MNSIKEITNYLFDIDYWSDEYDETENERFEILEKLLSDYPWKDIWNEWVLYLIEKCTTSRDIENYLDLLFAYEISKQFIPNPIDFAGYLYHRIGNDLLIGDLQHMMDSVIIHELCHLKYMNHSKEFYNEVLRVCPNYKQYDRWLKQNGAGIIRRLPRK